MSLWGLAALGKQEGVMGDGKSTKPTGWFSRRHRDGLAHREAVDDYKASRGPLARRRGAIDRLMLSLRGGTPEGQREYLALSKRIEGAA